MLPNLAASADLSTRGVDVSDTALVAEMLAVASAIVRGACGSPILETTSTVDLWATDSDAYLNLPGQPVSNVTAVIHDGDTLASSDYKLVHGRLWRQGGWAGDCEPLPVTVTMVHGFATVPDDVRQLVCDLAIAGLNAASSGARTPGLIAERIDDYSVQWATGAGAVATAMELPTATRLAFRRRFAAGVGVAVFR